MKILVTGGAGFIGSHLSEALLALGHDVTCLDNFSTGKRENIAHLPQLRVIEADANDAAAWSALKGEKFDAIYHYAAVVGVKLTEEQPLEVLKDAKGLLHLADYARTEKVKKVIFASSSEVYARVETFPSPELIGLHAWSPYTTIKLFGEHVLSSLWRADGIPTVSLRFFNVYGPRQNGSDYGFVVGKFVEQVKSGQSPTVFGDGLQTRDFVFIGDNVKAAVAALTSDSANGEVINIGTGRETCVLDLAKTVIEAAGKTGVIEPVHVPARKIEVARRCASTEKLSNLLNVKCATRLRDGIRYMLASAEPETVQATEGVAA